MVEFLKIIVCAVIVFRLSNNARTKGTSIIAWALAGIAIYMTITLAFVWFAGFVMKAAEIRLSRTPAFFTLTVLNLTAIALGWYSTTFLQRALNRRPDVEPDDFIPNIRSSDAIRNQLLLFIPALIISIVLGVMGGLTRWGGAGDILPIIFAGYLIPFFCIVQAHRFPDPFFVTIQVLTLSTLHVLSSLPFYVDRNWLAALFILIAEGVILGWSLSFAVQKRIKEMQ